MNDPREQRDAVLSRAHQRTAGSLTMACLTLMVVYGGYESYRRGRLIDIEHRPPVSLNQPLTQIDVNVAEWFELTLLPGISETMARRIVEHRVQNGLFHRVDDLLAVHGIGPRSLNRITPYLLPLRKSLDDVPGDATMVAE